MAGGEPIGPMILRLRKERGLSQADLARKLNEAAGGAPTLDRQHIYRWETGRRTPRDWLPFLAAVFRVDIEVLERATAFAKTEIRPTPVKEVEDTNRRTFVSGMALAVAPGLSVAPRHVDPALVPYFQQQLEGHYRADMMLGPRALIGTVIAQCELIGQLVDNADGPTRQRMAQVGTSYAAFAAWLHLDAGDPLTALRWHDVAQELAHRSRDREAIACALVDRAMARTDQGMGAAVVDLCESVLMDQQLPPELRVFALQQQAHGASLLSDRREEVDELLDEASRLVDRVDVEVWGTACLRTPNYVEVQRATCYGRLGLAKEADRLWQQIIPNAPLTARRDVGVWSARQATTAAAQRDPERAVDLTRQAAGIVRETGSARAHRELVAVEAAMKPWHAEAVGQDLAEVLASVSEGV